jgi:hypothetical protein
MVLMISAQGVEIPFAKLANEFECLIQCKFCGPFLGRCVPTYVKYCCGFSHVSEISMNCIHHYITAVLCELSTTVFSTSAMEKNYQQNLFYISYVIHWSLLNLLSSTLSIHAKYSRHLLSTSKFPTS